MAKSGSVAARRPARTDEADYPLGRLAPGFLGLAAALLLLFFSGCATGGSPARWDASGEFERGAGLSYEMGCVFRDFNRMGGSVCMGISGPYASKKKAFRAAAEDCLRYLALYEGMAVRQDLDSVVDESRGWNHFTASEIGGVADSVFNSAASKLEIVEAKWYGDKIGAVVYARLPGCEDGLWKRLAGWDGGLPSSDDGHVYVEAVSRKRYSHPARAVEASAFAAARKFLEASPSAVMVDSTFTEQTGENFGSDSYSIIADKFKGFRILALRYGEDGRVRLLASVEE